MGHAPSKISRISAIFKDCAPLHATSHGGGALVVEVVIMFVGGGRKSRGQTHGLPLLARFVILHV
jgi:hypothetical protein